MVFIKRAYDAAVSRDGFRILVDRLWPRGLSKERAQIDIWLKDIAPSTELRQWYNHDPKKWANFKKRYAQELEDRSESIAALTDIIREKKTVTLVYAARDTQHNNAIALCELLHIRHTMKS